MHVFNSKITRKTFEIDKRPLCHCGKMVQLNADGFTDWRGWRLLLCLWARRHLTYLSLAWWLEAGGEEESWPGFHQKLPTTGCCVCGNYFSYKKHILIWCSNQRLISFFFLLPLYFEISIIWHPWSLDSGSSSGLLWDHCYGFRNMMR